MIGDFLIYIYNLNISLVFYYNFFNEIILLFFSVFVKLRLDGPELASDHYATMGLYRVVDQQSTPEGLHSSMSSTSSSSSSSTAPLSSVVVPAAPTTTNVGNVAAKLRRGVIVAKRLVAQDTLEIDVELSNSDANVQIPLG